MQELLIGFFKISFVFDLLGDASSRPAPHLARRASSWPSQPALLSFDLAVLRSSHCCKSLEPQQPLIPQEVPNLAPVVTTSVQGRRPTARLEVPTENTCHTLCRTRPSYPSVPSLPRTGILKVQCKVSEEEKYRGVRGTITIQAWVVPKNLDELIGRTRARPAEI